MARSIDQWPDDGGIALQQPRPEQGGDRSAMLGGILLSWGGSDQNIGL
jgi:hypothetical protein